MLFRSAQLRHVVWPESVTTAEPEVFSGCVNLETVISGCESPEPANLQSAVPVPWKEVKDRAFYNCRKLSTVTWKDIHTVGKEAFFGCASLTLGRAVSLQQAGEAAFQGVGGIKEASGLSVAGSILVSGGPCEGEVRIPEGITEIAPFAFSGNRRITELILPETLRHIGEGAFWG